LWYTTPMRYANLTNGLEWWRPGDGFVRIQSTACEQKRWDFILQELPDDLYMRLAMGESCTIVDGNEKGMPRALWQGVPWVVYAVTRYWTGNEPQAFVRGHNVTRYFSEVYGRMEERTCAKLRYFKRFVSTPEIRLVPEGHKTSRDGQYSYFVAKMSA